MIDVARTKIDDGLACVICHLDFTSVEAIGVASVPVGTCEETGSSVFACDTCCGEHDEREGDQA